MHFWNKLSTAALMRLTILASLNLLLGRLVGRWDILLHPWFFLIVVTLNLGLYAIMVYTGSLNKSLIGMMLGGLVATLTALAFGGMGPQTFMYRGPYQEFGRIAESGLNQVLASMPPRVYKGGPLRLHWETVQLIGFAVVNAAGLMLIAAGGWIARAMNEESRSPDAPTPPPSS